MNLLIIDTETTGVDPAKDQVIEVGAILYSVDHQTTLNQISFLLYAEDNPAETINRIPAEVVKQVNLDLKRLSQLALITMASLADYAVAHNAEFDSQWFDGNDLPILKGRDKEPLKWLCTMSGMTWPKQSKPGESLVNLALHHGIGVSSAHRALTDCQLIAELFSRVSVEELRSLITEAARPQALFKANVSYEQKDLAKAEGFRWNAEDKQWERKMAIDDAKRLPFHVSPLEIYW